MSRIASILLMAALSASASAPAQRASDPGGTKSDAILFVGFSYLTRSYAYTQLNRVSAGMPGWDAAVSFPHALARRVGLAGDFSGHYQTSGYFKPQIYSLMAGPEFRWSVGRSRVYVHGLGGVMFSTTDVVAQTTSHHAALGASGAGVDFPIRSRLTWRANFDWFLGGFGTNDHNHTNNIIYNNPRLSTGPVFHF